MRGGAAPSDESKRGSLLGPPLFARWPCLRLSARGTRARGATQNGDWCCHQSPLCRAPPCGGHGRSGRRLRSQPRRLELRRLASRTSTALLHLHPSRPFRACLSEVPDLFAPPVQPCVLACACRLVVLVGALAHGWYPCPSPLRPCLRGTAHGCGLAFQPLGCCPCHCAQNIPVKVRPGGFGCGDALRNLRSLRFRAWGCPRARGALAGVSAQAGGRFRRRFGLIFTSPTAAPSRALQPHHLPISIPTRRQEYASSMAITASFRWHFCRRQFPATGECSHLPGESSKQKFRHSACG